VNSRRMMTHPFCTFLIPMHKQRGSCALVASRKHRKKTRWRASWSICLFHQLRLSLCGCVCLILFFFFFFFFLIIFVCFVVLALEPGWRNKRKPSEENGLSIMKWPSRTITGKEKEAVGDLTLSRDM
jgi:fatty acid desaturase